MAEQIDRSLRPKDIAKMLIFYRLLRRSATNKQLKKVLTMIIYNYHIQNAGDVDPLNLWLNPLQCQNTYIYTLFFIASHIAPV